jgi:predicted HTH transcriptional regulator
MMQNIGACKKENGILKFTNAGYLFFANNPRGYIPSAYIRFFKYDTDLQTHPEPTTIILIEK